MIPNYKDYKLEFGDDYKLEFGDEYKVKFSDDYKLKFSDDYKLEIRRVCQYNNTLIIKYYIYIIKNTNIRLFIVSFVDGSHKAFYFVLDDILLYIKNSVNIYGINIGSKLTFNEIVRNYNIIMEEYNDYENHIFVDMTFIMELFHKNINSKKYIVFFNMFFRLILDQ